MSTGGRFSPIHGRSAFALSPAVIITAVLLIVTGALIFLHRIGPPGDPQSIVILQVTEQVESDEAWTVGTDDVTIYVPANSSLQDGTISIKRVEPDLVPVSNDIWTRPIVVLIEFMDAEGRLVPDFRFLKRVEVCFRLTEEEWADSIQRPTSYQVQFYPPEEQLAYWDVLPMRSYSENFELCGLTTRLGMFALAIELQPEIPITGPTRAVLPQPTSIIPRDNIEPSPTRGRERPTSTVPASTSTPQPPPPTDTPLPAPTNTNPPPPPDTPRPPNPGGPPTDAPRPPNPGGPPTDAPRPPNPGGPPTDGPRPPNPGGPPTDAGPPPDRGRPTDAGPPPDRGRPTDAGPPPDRGPPPDAGPPPDKGRP